MARVFSYINLALSLSFRRNLNHFLAKNFENKI